jgi:hypothetical protein
MLHFDDRTAVLVMTGLTIRMALQLICLAWCFSHLTGKHARTSPYFATEWQSKSTPSQAHDSRKGNLIDGWLH